jgi:hypothetical protein
METSLVPAAQYLRMSTDHQQYSLQNQADRDRARGRIEAPKAERKRATVVGLLDDRNTAIESLVVFRRISRMRLRPEKGLGPGVALGRISELLIALEQVRKVGTEPAA